MKPTDFDFHLATDCYVRVPPAERGGGRLLVLHRATGEIEHRKVAELPKLLEGWEVWGNDAKLVPIRFEIELPGGHLTDALTLETAPDGLTLKTMARLPNQYSVKGTRLKVVGGDEVEVLGREKSTTEIRLPQPMPGAALSYSLPPWCDRPPGPVDWGRYEPLYARREGSIARASAGACLEAAALDRLAMRYLTLFVHLGSFAELPEQGVEFHKPHPEDYRFYDGTPTPGRADGKVAAIGSTALRALSAFEKTGQAEGTTDLFICPPDWRSDLVGAFLTNLHFPMESVLVLTCAFGGKENVIRAHEEAVKKGYRFGDWGDSLLVMD